jgi:hypothetical protein
MLSVLSRIENVSLTVYTHFWVKNTAFSALLFMVLQMLLEASSEPESMFWKEKHTLTTKEDLFRHSNEKKFIYPNKTYVHAVADVYTQKVIVFPSTLVSQANKERRLRALNS